MEEAGSSCLVGHTAALDREQFHGGYFGSNVPDEVILKIFGWLDEKDLCRLSCVCKRFNRIANDNNLWKSLHRNLFGYELPLFRATPYVFEFREPQDSKCEAPWKDSFQQLCGGIHVYPDEQYHRSGRYCFSSIGEAVEYAHRICKPDMTQIIFIHPGEYYLFEKIEISCEIAMIGAGSGNIAEKVVIFQNQVTAHVGFTFRDGAGHSYLGYVSVKPVRYSSGTEELFQQNSLGSSYVAIRTRNACVSPTIDHCEIGTPSPLPNTFGVYVTGIASVRHCRITDCKVGLRICHGYGGCEGNFLSGNGVGIDVSHLSYAHIKENKVCNQTKIGVLLECHGSGELELNDIHDNEVNISVYNHPAETNQVANNPFNFLSIDRNRIFRGKTGGIRVVNSSKILIFSNKFSQNNGNDVRIVDRSRVNLKGNVFVGSKDVVKFDLGCTVKMANNSFSN